MSELKRCPFCGGEAEFYRTAIKTNGSWCDSVVVKCKECEARTGRILYDAQKHPNDKEYDEAAVLWNTRKPVDAVHGEWLEKEDMMLETYYDCSVCGESYCNMEGTPAQNLFNFCPNCGADMREEKK